MSLFLRNLFFTLLQPGLVAGLIPYWIVRRSVDVTEVPSQLHQFAGLIIMAAGICGLLTCITMFGRYGKGTLSPVDPTRHLVIQGFYRYSRNPMYISVVTLLTGEVFYTLSVNLTIYTVLVWIAFNLFIILHEEPRLKRDFGEEYAEYCRKVRRWL